MWPNSSTARRRIFYVALTRARRQVHILLDRKQPSAFALELMEGDYEVQHVGRGADADFIDPD